MTRKSKNRINRDRTARTPGQPVSWQQFFTGQITKIRKAFGEPVRVTIVVRRNEKDGIAALYGDDDIDQVIADMQAKRDLFLASKQAAASESPVAEDPTNG
jgi:hypothetical protein